MRICVVVGFLLTVTSMDEVRARQMSDARLIGVVLEERTSHPIPLATIRLTGSDEGTVTDDSGRFVLRLAPGRHHFSIRAIDYTWVLNDDLEFEGIPRRLTPRTFNVRLKLRF